jgi:dienelactone hydrolase
MATPLRNLFVSLFIFYSLQGLAQTHTPKYVSMANFTNGYYEYLPKGYDPNGSQLYPLILFLHGGGDIGDGSAEQLPRLLKVGLTKQINNGDFPTSFTVNGKNFSFIIISPQFIQMPPTDQAVSSIESILNYVQKNYKVDPTRIYLTGLSKGGGNVFDYVGRNAANEKKIAAIVTSAEASYPDHTKARTIAASNLPVWATHNQGDQDISVNYTIDYINMINEAPAPNPPAKKTIFPGSGHDAWTQTYWQEWRENGLNIYEWMLQYQRLPVVTPIPSPPVSPIGLTLSPVPAKDKMEIVLIGPENGQVNAEIYSSNGALVQQLTLKKQSTTFQTTLFLNGFPAGIYFLKIQFGNTKTIRSFMKN